jgi:tRNA (mo5U34)-methyltransferase
MTAPAQIHAQVQALGWYHTIDLGGGLITPGAYDHRPYVGAYGFPRDLKGRNALDVGASNGFFTFELERRGAVVTSTDLPQWDAHDFGPQYVAPMDAGAAEGLLHDAYRLAHTALGARAERRLINIYDLSPEAVGQFDLVFCGSVLLHLTDPARALQRLQSVTREAAIIATVLYPLATPEPIARFMGEPGGFTWWYPNRAAFEALVRSAGFAGYEWYSEFRLDYAGGQPGPYHGVIRAWNTPTRPAWLDDADPLPAGLVEETIAPAGLGVTEGAGNGVAKNPAPAASVSPPSNLRQKLRAFFTP